MKRDELIDELILLLGKQVQQLSTFYNLADEVLNWKYISDNWNILECAEHLNLYFDFYIPEIERCLAKNEKSSNSDFRSGIIGSYFIKVIKPSERMNKIKTLDDMNPLGKKLDKNVLNKLESNILQFQIILEDTKSYNLMRIKTNISISKFIKLKLGDTLRFVVYHNERHFLQMNNIFDQYKIHHQIL